MFKSLLLVAITVFCLPTLANANTTVIHMYDEHYEPQDITISVGDTVSFENEGEESRWPASNIHPTHRAYPGSDIADCATEQAGSMFDACRELKPGESYSFTFLEAGAWRYHDHLEADIGGTITVLGGNEAPASNQSTWLKTFWNKLREFFQKLFMNTSETVSLETPTPEVTNELPTSDITAEDESIVTDHDALYEYVKKFGVPKALEQLYAITGSSLVCHDNAHNVGRYAYELLGTAAFGECSMLCQSGCYHGAVEAYFREHGTSDIGSNTSTLCSGITNSFVLHQCRHGVGHGLMAWSNYELFDALEGCDLLPDETARGSCYSGVFMENIAQSMATFLELDGHTTDYVSEDPHFPCNIVDKKYQPDCYFLQTDRMMELAHNDVATVDNNCREVPDFFSRLRCFQSLGRTIAGLFNNDPSETYKACHIVIDPNDRHNCLIGAVNNTFWDKTGAEEARLLCEAMTLPSEKNMCYDKTFNSALLMFEAFEEQVAFCDTIEPHYNNECMLVMESNQPGSVWEPFNEFR